MAKYVNSDGLAYYNTKIKALLAGKAAASHTHNYSGSASAGGSAKSVANSLSIQLNGGAATTFNGSAARSINITASSVGAAASRHSHNRLELMGTDSITTPTQDTQSNWAKVGNSVHFFTKTGEITDQKSQYGFVVNITNEASDVHQVWMTQTSGSLYHRGGNNSGWSGTWRRIIDSTELVNNKNSTGCLNTFNTDWSKIPSLNTLAYWDGAWGMNDAKTWHYSNLEYCKIGKFGSGAIRNITYGTAAPSGTANTGDIYIQYS